MRPSLRKLWSQRIWNLNFLWGGSNGSGNKLKTFSNKLTWMQPDASVNRINSIWLWTFPSRKFSPARPLCRLQPSLLWDSTVCYCPTTATRDAGWEFQRGNIWWPARKCDKKKFSTSRQIIIYHRLPYLGSNCEHDGEIISINNLIDVGTHRLVTLRPCAVHQWQEIYSFCGSDTKDERYAFNNEHVYIFGVACFLSCSSSPLSVSVTWRNRFFSRFE